MRRIVVESVVVRQLSMVPERSENRRIEAPSQSGCESHQIWILTSGEFSSVWLSAARIA